MDFFKNSNFYEKWKEKKYKDALQQPIEPPKSKEERISAFLFGDQTERTVSLGVAGLSIGDFIYDYIRIDPVVVEGINFSRTDNIDSIFAFSHFSKGIDPNSVGDISQMQGYVAEKMLAMELTAKGHEVAFPATSNEPGWDILVDGEKFQVKNLSDPSGVYEHLNKYPDIPVFVNADLANTFSDHPNVYIAENIHHQEIVDLTRDNIILGQELQDFEFPFITALVSTAVNVRGLMKHESDLKHTISNIVTDTVSRSVGGYIGQHSGAIAGGLLFGPAGVIVISGAGAFVGVSQGGKVAGVIKKLAAKEEHYRYRKDLTELLDKVVDEIEPKIERRKQQWERVRNRLVIASAPNELIDTFADKHTDDKRYLANKKRELNELKSKLNEMSHDESYQEALTLISQTGIHPSKYQKFLEKCNRSLKLLIEKLKKKGF